MNKIIKHEYKHDLVDFEDRKIKIGTTKEAKKLKLFSRCVHILLINKNGELMLSKRPPTTYDYPNKISSSAGGHVDIGETYKTAAQRELKEELGIHTPIKDIGRFDVITPNERTIHHLFIGKYKKVIADPKEISSFHFLSHSAIKKDISLHPRKYAKSFHEAFKCFMNYKNNI